MAPSLCVGWCMAMTWKYLLLPSHSALTNSSTRGNATNFFVPSLLYSVALGSLTKTEASILIGFYGLVERVVSYSLFLFNIKVSMTVTLVHVQVKTEFIDRFI